MIDAQASATTLLRAMADGRASAQVCLAAMTPNRVHAEELNAFLPVDLDAPGQAAASDARRHTGTEGVLEGLMVSVKDNIAVGAAPTTGGSPALQGYALAEGTAIARLRTAGVIFTGKTNLHELAFGITGENAFLGPAQNPFSRSRLAGGSTSGGAVAVAIGACAVAIGTDTGGSCRVPAAHCGVVGFRPTTGRYPDDGYLTLSPSRDTLGVLARAVADIAEVDAVMADDTVELHAVSISDLRLGVVRFQPIDPGVHSAFERALRQLGGAGVALNDVDLTAAIAADDACGFVIAVFETARSMATRAQLELGLTLADFSAKIADPDVRALIGNEAGPDATPTTVYREAIDVHLPRLKSAFADAVSGIDALIYPTAPLTAPPLVPGDTVDVNGVIIPTFPAYSMMTRPDSMAGLPSISLPNGLVAGLPTGIQLVSAPGSDRRLLAMAEAVEAVLPPRPIASLELGRNSL
jgi:mandelamide amidase